MNCELSNHVLITMRFAGTRYHGFQVQKNALSVCEALQNALERLYGTRPPVKGCSRTDAGVHALGYCVSYFQPKPIEPRRLPLAVNRFLPEDIRVVAARAVPEDFHARYSAESKEYIYRIHNSSIADPFQNGLCWRVPAKLDEAAMACAAEALVGTHDFAAFCSVGSDVADTVRTVHFARVERTGEDITFHVSANGYLYNMVRIMVGTLVDAGAGRMPPQRMREIIAGKDRSAAGDTAPPQGLFLYRVNYPLLDTVQDAEEQDLQEQCTEHGAERETQSRGAGAAVPARAQETEDF